jgi:hypothetical protein
MVTLPGVDGKLLEVQMYLYVYTEAVGAQHCLFVGKLPTAVNGVVTNCRAIGAFRGE